MNIQAIVVTHNNSATIDTCLSSLKQNNIPATVIDNASTDDTVKKIKEYPDVKLILSPRNIGFAAAANQAAALTTVDALLFINPDANLPAEAREKIVNALDKYSHAGIIGLLLCDTNNHPEAQGFGQKVTPLNLLIRKINQVKAPSKALEVDWVSGGALVVRANVWHKLQGFDPQFFMYWEDVDLCLRAQKAGYKILLTPAVKVIHNKGTSFVNNDQKTKLYDQSADRYFRKHYAFPIWGILHLGRYLYRLMGNRAK